jgi:hypothetical protein
VIALLPQRQIIDVQESFMTPTGKHLSGYWEQVGSYFNDDNPMYEFEKYRRCRVIFQPIEWRIGKTSLPPDDSQGVK